MCNVCFVRPVGIGKRGLPLKRCRKCYDEGYSRVRRVVREAIATGTCYRCFNAPAEAGIKRCAACHEKYLADQREKYATDEQFRERALTRNVRWSRERRGVHLAKGHRSRAARREAPGSFTSDEWDAIVAKQRGRCANCKKKRKLTMDHIVPISKGGSNFAFNIQGLCKPCNSSKRDALIAGAHFSLFDRVELAVA